MAGHRDYAMTGHFGGDSYPDLSKLVDFFGRLGACGGEAPQTGHVQGSGIKAPIRDVDVPVPAMARPSLLCSQSIQTRMVGVITLSVPAKPRSTVPSAASSQG